MVLDGSRRVDSILNMAMPWDVVVGVARRSWALNRNALETAEAYNLANGEYEHITLPSLPDDALLDGLFQ